MVSPDPTHPLGRAFYVYSASHIFGPEVFGFIVQHKRTGLMVWTSRSITLLEAAERLLRAAGELEKNDS